MDIHEHISEIFEFLKEDCSYYAITGTIYVTDIDKDKYQIQTVEDYSFDHIFFHKKGSPAMEDYYHGITLIPIGSDVYVKCEWIS